MVTSTVAVRGRCVTYGTGLALQPALVAVTPRHFAWQAWHLVTSTSVLRGRRGTYGPWSHIPSFRLASAALGDPPSFRVAGVALMALGWLRWGAWAGFSQHFSRAIFVTHHLSHTIFDTPSFTHHFVTHHFTHHFVTHHLSHTIFHTPLCHTPSFAHNCATHHLLHTTFTH